MKDRYCVAQMSEASTMSLWYVVVDQFDPRNHRVMARCDEKGPATLIAAALNMMGGTK